MPTIGVSIALPDGCGRELQSYRLALGDESARHIPSHITLVPPLAVEAADLDAAYAHLDDVAARHSAFGVHLRGTGTFRPVSPVVFIGVVEGISECELLAMDVCAGPLAVDSEFPYHPHVTIAHHLDDAVMDQAFAEMADFECDFEVASMWLYLHDADQGWLKEREFRLG